MFDLQSRSSHRFEYEEYQSIRRIADRNEHCKESICCRKPENKMQYKLRQSTIVICQEIFVASNKIVNNLGPTVISNKFSCSLFGTTSHTHTHAHTLARMHTHTNTVRQAQIHSLPLSLFSLSLSPWMLSQLSSRSSFFKISASSATQFCSRSRNHFPFKKFLTAVATFGPSVVPFYKKKSE